MRSYWLVVAASAGLLAGCATQGGTLGTSGYTVTQQTPGATPQVAAGAAPQLAGGVSPQGWIPQTPNTPNYGATPAAPESWTDRVVTTLTQNPLTTLGLTGGVVENRYPVDTLSLNYGTGEPTPDLTLSMAQLAKDAGDPARARQLYEKVLAADQRNAKALIGLARLEDAEDRFPQALAIYQNAAACNPNDAAVLNDLGLCYARAGQMEQSLRALHAATKVDPAKPLYRNNIAKVLVAVNQLDNALAELAVVHAPATANYNLAVLLSEAGRLPEATHFATVAVQIDPQNQLAHALLEGLNPAAAPAMYGASPYGAPHVASTVAATPLVSQRPATGGGPTAPVVRPSTTTGYSPWPTPGSAAATPQIAPGSMFAPESQPWPDAVSEATPVTTSRAPAPAGPEPTVLPPVG